MKVAIVFTVLLLAGAGEARAQKKPHKVNCIARNKPYDELDAKTRKVQEKDNWEVSCQIERDGKVIYERGLPLPFSATLAEAVEAIEEFRTKKAPEILKEMDKK